MHIAIGSSKAWLYLHWLGCEKPWPWLTELGICLSIVTYVSPVAQFATVIKVE